MESSYLRDIAGIKHDLALFSIQMKDLIKDKTDHLMMMNDTNGTRNIHHLRRFERLSNDLNILELQMKNRRLDLEEVNDKYTTYQHQEMHKAYAVLKQQKDKLNSPSD
tara:strand:- start:55 stop:378 length:324 start_codon:yes stop_codon:yes gene_type:complete